MKQSAIAFLALCTLLGAHAIAAEPHPRPSSDEEKKGKNAPGSKPGPETPQAQSLGPGDHERNLTVAQRERSYLIHVPPQYDAKKPTPVILILHGAATNGRITARFTGMNEKSDKAGFIAVYPNGTGAAGVFLTWNSGGLPERMARGKPDDVAFIRALLDDLATVLHVDPKRIHATGISNGGMMCYRLAAELSDRIASIAPVAGTMTASDPKPKRPVPVLHFHGTDDSFVPFGGPNGRVHRGMTFKSVEESIRAWCEVNGCPIVPAIQEELDKVEDGTRVRRKTYGPGRDGAEVVLFEITGGGHTWPGRSPLVGFIGKSTFDISANDILWEFFQRHPLR